MTEHEVIDDYQKLNGALGRLRDHRGLLAVDDTGAGFASLRHIVSLTPEFIKLDVSLTREVRLDPVRRALATSLIQFAHQIGSMLVVEGVEEHADLDAWQELGAHAAQGYLLAHPGPLPAAPDSPLVDHREERRIGVTNMVANRYAEGAT